MGGDEGQTDGCQAGQIERELQPSRDPGAPFSEARPTGHIEGPRDGQDEHDIGAVITCRLGEALEHRVRDDDPEESSRG